MSVLSLNIKKSNNPASAPLKGAGRCMIQGPGMLPVPIAPKPMTDWQQRRAYIEADSEHQKLEAVARNAARLANECESDLRSQTFKLQRLLMLRDLAVHQLCKFEDLDDDVSEKLEELTTDCPDCWQGSYSQAADDVTDLIFDLCGKITDQRPTLKRLEDARSAAWQALRERADELGKQWEAQQTEAVA